MQTLKFVCLDCMDFKYEDLGGHDRKDRQTVAEFVVSFGFVFR
jgi:hypothetical protein